jgi:hypothetical protein
MDDVVVYNTFLGSLLVHLKDLEAALDKKAKSTTEQLTIVRTFLLQNTDLAAIYYTIDMDFVTSILLDLVESQLSTFKQSLTQLQPNRIDFGIATA